MNHSTALTPLRPGRSRLFFLIFSRFFFLPAFASWQTRGSNCLLDWAARGDKVLNARVPMRCHGSTRSSVFVPFDGRCHECHGTPWRLQPPEQKPEKLNFYESFKSMQLEQTNHFSSIFIHEKKLAKNISTFVCQQSWHHKSHFIPFSVPELLPEKSGDSTCHRMSMSSSIPKRPLTTSLGVVFKTAAVWFPDAKCRSKTP